MSLDEGRVTVSSNKGLEDNPMIHSVILKNERTILWFTVQSNMGLEDNPMIHSVFKQGVRDPMIHSAFKQMGWWHSMLTGTSSSTLNSNTSKISTGSLSRNCAVWCLVFVRPFRGGAKFFWTRSNFGRRCMRDFSESVFCFVTTLKGLLVFLFWRERKLSYLQNFLSWSLDFDAKNTLQLQERTHGWQSKQKKKRKRFCKRRNWFSVCGQR